MVTRVSDIMTRDLVALPESASVAEGLHRAKAREVHHVLIVRERRLRGVTCVCDLRERPVDALLSSVIQRPAELIWAQIGVDEAVQRFLDKGVSCFPVCDGDELVGVVTRSDLRRSGVDEEQLPGSFECVFCGSHRHVRARDGLADLAACLECSDCAAPAAAGLFDEGVKD